MERRVAILLVVVGGVACGASTTPQTRPLVAEDRRPEGRDLPPEASSEALPEGIPADPPESYVEPIEVGSCVSADDVQVAAGPCPSWSGLAISEARAARDMIYRIRYDELRQTYEADRQVWSAHRELYEAQIQRDREEIERLQPGWFEEHDLELGVAAGLMLGAVMTVAIVWAVEGVTR